MATVSDQFRLNLQAAGLWDDFCTYRDSLRANGDQASVAYRKAVQKFRTGAEAGRAILQERQGRRKPDSPATSTPAASLPEIDPEVFSGKRASEADNIRWVADNILSANVTPVDAPSMTAYAMLSDCRSFPQFRIDFWKSMYIKLVSKGQIEDGEEESDGFDGEVQVSTIDRILQFKREATKAS